MSKDLSYLYKKEEANKNGSYYFKTGYGKHEKPFMTPYVYGSIKEKRGKKR